MHFIRIKSINVIFCDFDAEGSIKLSLPYCMEMHRFVNAAAVLEKSVQFRCLSFLCGGNLVYAKDTFSTHTHTQENSVCFSIHSI